MMYPPHSLRRPPPHPHLYTSHSDLRDRPIYWGWAVLEHQNMDQSNSIYKARDISGDTRTAISIFFSLLRMHLWFTRLRKESQNIPDVTSYRDSRGSYCCPTSFSRSQNRTSTKELPPGTSNIAHSGEHSSGAWWGVLPDKELWTNLSPLDAISRCPSSIWKMGTWIWPNLQFDPRHQVSDCAVQWWGSQRAFG